MSLRPVRGWAPSLRAHGGWLAGGTAVLAVAASGVWTGGQGPPGEAPRPGPLVDERVVAEALAAVPPDRPTLSDEIDHYEARLARRDAETFSHGRLFASHVLRFRAYGRLDDLETAEEHLRARHRATGDIPTVLSDLAALRLLRHEFTDALLAALEANRLANGRDPAVQFRLFDTYWAAGRTAAAEALLTQPLDRTSTEYQARQARVLDRAGEVERARDLFREIAAKTRAYAETAPVQAWALTELGHFEHHAGDPATAVGHFRDALRMLPGSPAALEALAGLAYGVDRDLDVAATLYRRALENGAHLDVMPVLAGVEEERGRPDEAARIRADFVDRATADARHERWYRRPLAFTLAEDPATVCQALALARADLDDRRDAGAWDTLAWALYRAGHLDAADEAARRATGDGVPEPGIAWRAGVIARATGDVERSGELLTEALDGASELSVAEEAEARRLLGGGEHDRSAPRAACRE